MEPPASETGMEQGVCFIMSARCQGPLHSGGGVQGGLDPLPILGWIPGSLTNTIPPLGLWVPEGPAGGFLREAWRGGFLLMAVANQ